MSDDFLAGVGAAIVRIIVIPIRLTVGVAVIAQMRAMGVLGNGSTVDISSLVVWASLDEAIATVDGTGRVDTIAAGSTEITARYVGLVGVCELTVSGAAPFGFQVFTYPVTEEASSFVIPLPVEEPDADYSIDAVIVDGDGAVDFLFAEEDRTADQFGVITTAPLSVGTLVQFTITRSS